MSSKSKKEYNFDIIDNIKKQAKRAYNDGYFIESMVIYFLMVETLLRINISRSIRIRKIPEKTNRKLSEDEQSFSRLVYYFELLNPNKKSLITDLFKVNKERNNIMHGLFKNKKNKFKDFEDLQTRAKKNIKKIVKLNSVLRDRILKNKV